MTQPAKNLHGSRQPYGSDLPAATLSGSARIVWFVLILATLYLCYFHNLGAFGLVGPDEPRYAWIARDMAETGDWVTPRLYGQPWFEKPVLYYWGAAASFKSFGVSEAAARLPSALSALLATLSLAWLALRIYGADTARWLLLLLPTTVGMIGFSHAAATDMPFAAMLTVAMVFAALIVGLARHDRTPVLPRTPWLALLFFGFFLGLAVLAKGPAAIILSGGAVFFWAAFTKRWRDALRCLHPVAIATFCLTALPWYIACAQRNPDFFRVFIIEHNFKRFLTPEFQHVQPFWYYIPVILVAFLPWTPAALISVTFELRRYLRGYRFSPSTVFFLCWSLFCLLFFSISKSKLPGYILPAVPATGMLLTKSYVYMTSQQSRVFRWIEFGIGILVAALGIALVSISFDQSTISKEVLLSEGWVIAALGIANAFLGIRRRKVFLSCNLVSFCVVPVLILLGCFNLLSPHFMAQDPSGKTLAGEIVASRIPLDEIYVANMRRGQLFSLNFYLHHVMKQWNPAEQHEGFVLVQFNSCREDHEELRLACADSSAKMTPSGWFIYKLKRSD